MKKVDEKYLSLLIGKGTISEMVAFFKSDQFDENDSDDNIINSFQEFLAESTDYDMEQEQKISYGKQFPESSKFTGI